MNYKVSEKTELSVKEEKELNEGRQIACVTGAFEVIGRRIVARLVSHVDEVRALSRSICFSDSDLGLFRYGLSAQTG